MICLGTGTPSTGGSQPAPLHGLEHEIPGSRRIPPVEPAAPLRQVFSSVTVPPQASDWVQGG